MTRPQKARPGRGVARPRPGGPRSRASPVSLMPLRPHCPPDSPPPPPPAREHNQPALVMAPPPEAKGAAPALPQEVARHYRDHGVEGMQEFLAPPTGGGNGDSCRDGDGDGDGDGGGGAPCRFVRLNPRYSREETLSLLREELGEGGRGGAFPAAVPWLRPAREMAFYALPSSFALSRSGCFRSGRVYGMDVSSGAAVAALLYDNHDAAGAGAASASAGGIGGDRREGGGAPEGAGPVLQPGAEAVRHRRLPGGERWRRRRRRGGGGVHRGGSRRQRG